MGYPLNDAGSFVLDVDASDQGIDAVLHQIQDGRERVIAYANRSFEQGREKLLYHRKRATGGAILHRILPPVFAG